MPRRDDLKRICVLGAGPIQIGQACEFDYSGTQACKALRSEGIEVILINSNPATIMTSPGLADKTYIEPLTVETVAKILAEEKPDAILPTLGGQTALSIALELHDQGILKDLGIELLGANAKAIRVAEDRDLFKQLMIKIGLDVARSGQAGNLQQAWDIARQTGFPLILRPSFTLGGVGGGIVQTPEQFEDMVSWALQMSPVHEVLIEESLLGLKEFEMEVMRDNKDRAVVICSIENFDPMGVHTGDSITVAPAQTLTDREYQRMRDASLAIIRAVGVETGGSNIQFSLDPTTERIIVIEMNPRVSRSSALASKATGFPIAKIAALLAIGYTLDEIDNDITQKTPACFEPTLDYVITKIPRFTFEKFPDSSDHLTTQMKSVGEVMGMGRSFGESLIKAVRGLDQNHNSLHAPPHIAALTTEAILQHIRTPTPDRLWQLAEALRRGLTPQALHNATSIDNWFLQEIQELITTPKEALQGLTADTVDAATWVHLKGLGLSDASLAQHLHTTELTVRHARQKAGVTPIFRRVDTCAAEFEAHTPYLYATYAQACEAKPDDKPRVLILGSGPNRIGQGIEFDTSCVKAAAALSQAGVTSIMLNCNPETVSTDHDTSDRLYFEPVDLEAVLNVIDIEQPLGVIVQLGGQTPLRLTEALLAQNVPILGTTADVIDLCEDRARFQTFAQQQNLKLPPQDTARTAPQAFAAAQTLGFPVLVRPSRVLGGQSMAILRSTQELDDYCNNFFLPNGHAKDPQALPLLLDSFLEGATEVDVDAVCDGTKVLIGGLMEQIESAGVHSGDSACIMPPMSLPQEIQDQIHDVTKKLALSLQIKGLMNIQFAIQGDDLYILEVNPRASRTLPFVEKATGVCLSTLATQVFLGQPLAQQGVLKPATWACKEVVLPWTRFPGASPILSPQMRSTGEVMAFGDTPAQAFGTAQSAASNAMRPQGWLLIDCAPACTPDLLTLRQALSHHALAASAQQAPALSDMLQQPVHVWDQDPSTLSLVAMLHPVGSPAPAHLPALLRTLSADHVPYVTTPQALHWTLEAATQAQTTPKPLQERLKNV